MTQVAYQQPAQEPPRLAVKKKSSLSKVFKLFKKYPMIPVGGFMVLVMIVVALLATPLSTHDPIHQYSSGLSQMGTPIGPNHQFLLGTDSLGRDVYSRVIHGTTVSLTVGVFASVISLVIGVALGVISGFFGKWVDSVIMRITDIILAFPFLLFVIALVAVLKPSVTNVYVAIGILGWAQMARVVRGEVLKVRESEYVQAARSFGTSSFFIIIQEVIPNIMAPVIVMGTLAVGQNIMMEAALSFLGIGVQLPTPSWGNMLQEGMQVYTMAPWMIYAPGLALLWATIGFNLLGDGLRDWLDPTL